MDKIVKDISHRVTEHTENKRTRTQMNTDSLKMLWRALEWPKQSRLASPPLAPPHPADAAALSPSLREVLELKHG